MKGRQILRIHGAGFKAATVLGLICLAAAVPARAETVVLRNGQSLAVTGYEKNGDALVLHLADGYVTVPADAVERIEPQVDFPPNPTPATPPLEVSIREAAERNGLDPELLSSVIAVESRFDPHAISRKNARGLMQLMPATSARLGVADVFDAGQNIAGGARYLRELLDRYHQDVRLALAAYNAGPGPVDRVHAVPYIPETRLYVEQVMRQWNARVNKPAAARTRFKKTTASSLPS
ncbi:MAG TPA: lytic transglycosylase domain-containing protein [Candidatus Binatia bacterium]|nr:lytic transglycosylase domain-containing protein [Candidatus Binatia bacterium]